MDSYPSARIPRIWLLASAAAVPLIVCALLSTMRDEVTQATSALMLVLIVVAAAATGDRVAGLVSALSGAAWFDFFLTQPYKTFTINAADDIEVTVLLVVIGTAVTEVALWGRRQQHRASARAGYLSGVAQVSDAIALRDQEPGAVRAYIARQIATVLGVSGCRFEPGAGHDPRNAVLQRDGLVVRNGHAIDVERNGLPTDEETVIPIQLGDAVLGHFVVTSATSVVRPTKEQLMVATILAEQAAKLGPVTEPP